MKHESSKFKEKTRNDKWPLLLCGQDSLNLNFL